MPHPRSVVAAVVALPLAIVLGWTIARAMASAESSDTATAKSVRADVGQERLTPAATRPTPHLVGAGSCAAAACHGEPADRNSAATWNNAYSLWFTRKDPHSRAYAVLTTETSKRILWLLDGSRTDGAARSDRPWLNATPHRDNRCLTCHSIVPDAGAEVPETLLADGVSCEACHGPADAWRASHTTMPWVGRGAKRYQTIDHNRQPANGEMWNTKDLVSRANICVRCHIGGADRDVNHDLIAAGHPRLNFEYQAFMEKLPRHWDDKWDRPRMQDQPGARQPKPSDYEVRLWAIGQAVSADAALGLLEQRARRSSQSTSPRQPEEVPQPGSRHFAAIASAWPELSEYDCYSCHRSLDVPGDAPVAANGARRRLGGLPWGTWYFSEVQGKVLPAMRPTLSGFEGPVTHLRDAMERITVPPATITRAVGDAKTTAVSYTNGWDRVSWSMADVDRLLTVFGELPTPQTWDEATQRYLALQALFKSSRKLAGKIDTPDDKDVDRRLTEIRDLLRFRDDYRSPAHLSAAHMQALQAKLVGVAAELKRWGPNDAK
jgi:hypothetical protein